MKTTEAVKALLKERGHSVLEDVPDNLYERFLHEVHEGDYRDVMSDLQEQELAMYMAATFDRFKGNVAEPVVGRPLEMLAESVDYDKILDFVWKALVVLELAWIGMK